jgi:hypothetical protein
MIGLVFGDAVHIDPRYRHWSLAILRWPWWKENPALGKDGVSADSDWGLRGRKTPSAMF